MNGQTARLEIARQLIKEGRTFIIETGTFRGTTTEWFAGFGLPVVTVESSPRYHAFAKRRLSRLDNIQLFLGDSTDCLKNMTTNGTRPFIYLDAHWEDRLPLAEEIEIAFDRWPKAIIMVDDCQVRDDPSYAYDDYGPGKAITEDYIKAIGLPNLQIFVPAVPGRDETGARRGCAVLAADIQIAAKIGRYQLLRS